MRRHRNAAWRRQHHRVMGGRGHQALDAFKSLAKGIGRLLSVHPGRGSEAREVISGSNPENQLFHGFVDVNDSVAAYHDAAEIGE